MKTILRRKERYKENDLYQVEDNIKSKNIIVHDCHYHHYHHHPISWKTIYIRLVKYRYILADGAGSLPHECSFYITQSRG